MWIKSNNLQSSVQSEHNKHFRWQIQITFLILQPPRSLCKGVTWLFKLTLFFSSWFSWHHMYLVFSPSSLFLITTSLLVDLANSSYSTKLPSFFFCELFFPLFSFTGTRGYCKPHQRKHSITHGTKEMHYNPFTMGWKALPYQTGA